jgi:hypothetical protein
MAWNSERCHNGIADRFYDDAFLGLDVAKEDLEMISHDVIRKRIAKVGIHLRRSFNVGEKKRRPLNAGTGEAPGARTGFYGQQDFPIARDPVQASRHDVNDLSRNR